MRRLLPILVASMFLGCAAVPPPHERTTPQRNEPSEGRRARRVEPNLAPVATLVAELPRGTSGPYVGGLGDTRIAVWARPHEGGYAWHSLRLGSEAHPLPLVATPSQPDLVVVRPMGGSSRDAAAVMVACSSADESALSLYRLDGEGRLLGAVETLTGLGKRVLWIDSHPTPTGATLLWASADSRSAVIQGTHVSAAGKLDSPRHEIATGVLAWQRAALGESSFIAVVREHGGERVVQVIRHDALGKPIGEPWIASAVPGAELDLDMIAQGEHLLLAWTQRTDLGLSVVRARLDPKDGLVDGPRPLLPELGDHALLRLVGSTIHSGRGYVVWEVASTVRKAVRKFTIGALTSTGDVGSERSELDFSGADGTVPEFAATQRGLAAITSAPACSPSEECFAEEPAPAYVEWDHALSVIASERILLTTPRERPVDLAWALSCAGGEPCRALGTTANGETATVYEFQLAGSSPSASPVARKLKRPQRPGIAGRQPIVQSESMADLASVDMGSGRIVAWVSDFDSTLPYKVPLEAAPDGKRAPVRALLDVVHVDAEGSRGQPLRVSWRARSVGGVDLAAGTDSALLIWSAIDNQRPEVFVTLLDSKGNKRQQRMLTHQRSEVYDVAAVRVDGGWVVAWIDARNGNPEVYSARLSERLELRGPAKRITKANGSASGLSLGRLGSGVLAVWSDDRADPAGGRSKIYHAILSANDASPRSRARPLHESEVHAHSAKVASTKDGAVIAWLEQAEGEEVALRMGRVDPGGSWVSEPKRVLAGVGIVALDVECAGASLCHGAIVGRGQGGAELQLIQVAGEERLVARRTVSALAGGLSRVPGLSMVSGRLHFSDATSAGVRIEELTLRW